MNNPQYGSQWQSFTNTAYNNLSNFANQNPIGRINVGQNTASSVPAWLQPNYGELQHQYQNVPSDYQNNVINPLRQNFQNTLSYNTTLGTQAANSASQEYATRAQQAGGSSQAAGVVRAQSLLPVFQQNSQARQQEAGTEASYASQAIGLQASLASQLAQLRTSYAGTLANYLTQQRGQDISQAQANQSASLSANNSLLSAGVSLANNPRAQGGFQGSGVTNAMGQNFNVGTTGYANVTNGF